MPFSFELNDRQSARVIEQAIRTGAAMCIDPHHGNGGKALSGQLTESAGHSLTFRLVSRQAARDCGLIPGQYCQVQFSLNDAMYLISVHVLDLDEEQACMRTSRPKKAQILDRRKFARSRLAARTPVMIRWLDGDRLVEAALFNVAGGGIAFKVGREFADRILVGDVMEAVFELAGLPRRFPFRISICNKTVASDNASIIVGAQFLEGPQDGQAGALDELRRFLAAQTQVTLTR
jgi:hypothetical protein